MQVGMKTRTDAVVRFSWRRGQIECSPMRLEDSMLRASSICIAQLETAPIDCLSLASPPLRARV